jgi:hypothetical protein
MLPRPVTYLLIVLPNAVACAAVACSNSTNTPGMDQSPTADGSSVPVNGGSSSSGGSSSNDGGAAIVADALPADSCVVSRIIPCAANSVAYLCTGSASMACAGGYAVRPDGVRETCCSLPASESTCQPEPDAGCATGQAGYVCSGSDTPPQSGTSLICVGGATGPSGTHFCCETYSSPSCKLNSTVGGCQSRYAVSCPPNNDPAQVSQPGFSLACTSFTGGMDAASLSCCAVSLVDASCAVDPTVPCPPATGYTVSGYSCTGTDTPSQDFAGVHCGNPAGTAGNTTYCCRTW